MERCSSVFVSWNGVRCFWNAYFERTRASLIRNSCIEEDNASLLENAYIEEDRASLFLKVHLE